MLVSIAVNAKTEAARNEVDATLLTLRQEGLIAYRRDAHRGNGLVVTTAGRALIEGKAAEPADNRADSPICQPEKRAETPVCQPAPDAEARPDRIDPAKQPALYALLCDMGGVVSECLAAAIDAGDLHQAARMQRLGYQVLRHTREVE